MTTATPSSVIASLDTSLTAPIRRPVDQRLERNGYPGRWRALPVLLVATFMALFDLFVVNVAAPSIQSSLHTGTAALELVVGGYSFTYAAGMVVGGRLGDLHGHRRLFVLGMAAFAVASALCGLSTTASELVVARLAQGAAAAMMVPQVLAAITAIFPANERARALSWFGLTIGLGAVAGQVLGGALLRLDVAHLGWRAIFLVNVPIGAIVAPLAAKLLPHTRSDSAVHIDVVGAIGSAVTVGLALIPLVLGRTEGWPVWTWVSFALVMPAGIVLVRHQRGLAATGGQPLLDLQLFQSRTFAAGSAVNAAFFAGFGGFILALTLALQAGWALTPLATGMTYLPLGIAFATASMLGRGLTAKYGARAIVRGMATSIAGYLSLLLLLAVDGVHTRPIDMVLPLILIGTGNGLTIPSLIGSVLATINPRHGGVAAGMLSTAQQFAAAAGVALTGVVFFGVVGKQVVGHAAGRPVFVHALEASVVTTGLLTLVAFGLGWLLPSRARAAAR
jgi:MFS family permease